MRFNISRFKADARCPRYYALRHVDPILGGLGIIKERESAPAASFGTACHETLRVQYEKGIDALDEGISVGRQCLIDDAATASDPEDRIRILEGTGGGERACEKCEGTGLTLVRKKPHAVCNGTGKFTPSGTEGIDYHEKMMRAHALEYPTDVWDKVLMVEKELEVDLENGHSLVGRLDLVAEWNGGIWELDHKTCHKGTNFAQEILAYEVDWQRHGYWMLIKEHFGEWPKGSWINLLRKTTMPTFYREPIAFDMKLVEDSFKFFQAKTTQLAALYEEKDFDAMKIERRATSCIAWNRPCTYLCLCNYKIPHEPEALGLMNFVKRKEDYTETWDDLKKEGEKSV